MTKSHVPPSAPVFTPAPRGLVQRCSCGARSGPSGECAECKRKRLGVQRKATRPGELERVPGIVHDVVRQSGRPLDGETRAFMESRLGHDFGDVRIHTDERAAASAGAVDARAYAVGNHVVFANGFYDPGTREGRRLIAHELVHVMQQAGGGMATARGIAQAGGQHEREADHVADRALAHGSVAVGDVTPAEPQVSRIGGKCMSAKIGYWAAFTAAVASCGGAIITSETGIGLVLLGAACVASIVAFIGAIVALIECMESDPDADRREIERLRAEQERMERRLRQVEEMTGAGGD